MSNYDVERDFNTSSVSCILKTPLSTEPNSIGPPPKLQSLPEVSAGCRTISMFSQDFTLTRSKMSLKHFTFKMGAENYLSGPQSKRPPKPKGQTSAMVVNSACTQNVELNDASSESNNSDYSSSNSCESSAGSSFILQRSVSMETLYSQNSTCNLSDTFRAQIHMKKCFQETDIRASSIGQSVLKEHGSNSPISNIEIDDSSHSESDLAFPIFVKQHLKDKLDLDLQMPKKVIRFGRSSDSDDTSTSDTLTFNNCPSSYDGVETIYQRSGSVESEVCGQAKGHLSRRDQLKPNSAPSSRQNFGSKLSPKNTGKESIRTRSQAASDLVRTRSRSHSLSGNTHFLQHPFQVPLKGKTTRKQSPRKTRSLEPRLQRSISLSRIEVSSVSGLFYKSNFDHPPFSASLISGCSPSRSPISSSKLGHKLKSKGNISTSYIETRSRSHIGTRSRSRSLSNSNRNSDGSSSHHLLSRDRDTSKNASPKKTASASDTKIRRRSASLSRYEKSSHSGLGGSYNYSFLTKKVSSQSSHFNNPVGMLCRFPFQESTSKEIKQTRVRSDGVCSGNQSVSQTLNNRASNLMLQPLLEKTSQILSSRKGTLRRCTSLSTIESSSLRGLVHESDLDSLSDASSATSNRVASLKANALTARKFRPPSQYEIEQRKLLHNLQWYNHFR